VSFSLADVAVLYAVVSEEERVSSSGGWDREVERLFVVRLGSSQELKADTRWSED
jgi:hypothetical protein